MKADRSDKKASSKLSDNELEILEQMHDLRKKKMPFLQQRYDILHQYKLSQLQKEE